MAQNVSGKSNILNFLWKFLERIGSQLVSFVVSIILARLLLPEDYGVIAVVTIFITIADVFVNVGLGAALIQKKDTDDLDYSSAFICNLGLAIILYCIIFFCSPLIAKWFEMPNLSLILKVLGSQVILASILSIQNSYVSKKRLFRKSFLATLIATVISAVVGILMAYWGCGVWALVAQQLSLSLISIICLVVILKWLPRFKFSFKRVRSLLPFGSKVLATGLIDVGVREVRQIIVGKKYTSTDLAYYNKGANFPQLIIANLNMPLKAILFPSMADLQDNKTKLLEVTRVAVRLLSFLYFPMMAGLAIVAKPMIGLLLTDKWLPCVLFLQVYCFEYATWNLQGPIECALKGAGAGNLLLFSEIIRKGGALLIVFIAMFFGMDAMAIAVIATAILNDFAYRCAGKIAIKYSFKEQFKDILSPFLLTLVMACVIYPLQFLLSNNWLLISSQVVIGIAVYLGVAILTKNKEMKAVLLLLKNFLKNMKGNKAEQTPSPNEDGLKENEEEVTSD